MQLKTENWHDYIHDIMSMRSREEWANKFQANTEYILDDFFELRNMDTNDIHNVMAEHGEYMLSQLAGIFIETFLSTYFEDGSNVVNAYIKRFKHRFSRDQIKIFESLRDTYFSIYKVVDVKENEYSILQDILFDTNEIKVIEHSGSKREMIGEHILADVVNFDGEYFFSGVVLHLVKSHIIEMTSEIKKEIKKMKWSYKNRDLAPIDEVRELLEDFYPTFFYYALAPYVIKPTIINPNGDEFSPKTCKFKIKQENQEKIREILNNIDNYKDYQIRNTDKDSWSVHILRKSSKKIKKTDLNTNDYIPYADIVMEKDYLKILAIYSNELDKIIKILQQKLKDLIGLAILEDLDPNEIELFSNKDQKDIKDEIPPEQLKEIMKIFWDKYLKETLKMKIPVLHNLTPKQCLKKDPETFYQWWEHFKENIEEQTEGLYDFSWFIEELGI